MPCCIAPSPKNATEIEVFLQSLGGEPGADDVRDAAADDCVRAEMPERAVGDVHRAALAAAVADLAPADLRHHAFGIGAASEEYAVAAMMRGEGVLRLHGRANAGGGGFLADRQMQHRAGREPTHVEFADMLFERSNPPHKAVEINQRRVGDHCRLRERRALFS